VRTNSDWERVLIASDLHSVFLDRRCFKIFLGVCREFPWDRVILNGDVLDCTTISEHVSRVDFFHPEVLDGYSFDAELSMTYEEILKPLRRAIGSKTKLQLRLGNHEIRFLRPNRANAHALADIHETCAKRGATRLEDLMKLDKVGATLSYNAVDTLYGTFHLIHGVKTGQGAAKANLLRYGSGTSGHSHRGNCFTQKMQGQLQGWWESACLRTIENVEYLPHGDSPDWCNGFLTLTINRRTGTFFCTPHFIVGNKCEVQGQLFSV